MKFRNIPNSWTKLARIEKVNFVMLSFIRITLVVAILSSIYNFRWFVLFTSSAVFILTFAPKWFERKYNIDLPIEFEIVAVLFIYGSLFLGEIHGYYTRFWWWDLILHGMAAVALGFLGFTVLYVLHRSDKIKASARTLALFTFFFSLGFGALWEIFEFAMDQIFGWNMQKSGLIDTMWDLIVDGGGALIASLAGYFYLKKGTFKFLEGLMERFVENNPQLFVDD